MTSATIAICTYNRYEILEKSINAVLDNCNIDGINFELMVVENTPHNLRKPIEFKQKIGTRTVVCEELGLAHARNAAINNSDSDIIIFLDDDAFVRPGWLEAYISTFDTVEKAFVVGGKCHALYEDPELPKWFDESLNGYLSCIDWGNKAKFISAAEWVVGANVAFRRSIFADVGYFDTTLGRKGASTLLSNEETSLMEKIGRAHIYYQPKAKVDHFVPAARVTLEWFRKRVYWQAISDLLAGTTWISAEDAEKEYRDLVMQTDAQYRNLDVFNYRPRNYQEFERQMRTIYVAAMIGAEGYRLGND